MYVLEHFAKDVLGDDYEAVYAVHTDREHMHGHLIWNSVSMTTGKKYNSPKNNWKNHLQPITNKYCDELGLSVMPAEYSRNPKNISRDKWEKEMSMKEIILRDAKMRAYAAGNVEHFKYLMKRLGYVFKKDAWMEVQAPGFRYYHSLAKMDEMFAEDRLRHHVDMPWMAKPYFYSSDIRGLHREKLSPYEDEHKRKNEIFTNDFLDLFHYASLNSHILVCDDRWANSYNNFNDCFIYSVTDIVELLHEQRIISDEKYINVITQMFNEGYAYIVPPFEYMKLLLEQVPDGKDVSQEIPEELSIMCDYLVYITASESKLDDDMIHQGVMPESAGYMYNLQRELTKLMKYVWCTERGELWKCQVSDWLLANYSVFSYRTVMNESVDSGNQNYYELELSNFLFSGFCEIPGNSYRKEYYSWLFNWFSKNNQWKNGLEDRLIQSLANLISEVYRHESGTPYKDIGIGMLVLSVTADMPEYYRNLIRKNASIAPIIEKFEDNFVYLGEKDFILREHFNQWLEDAMKQGIDCSIIRTNETTKREYTITFIVNELFHQGFKIEYIDDARNKRIHYFRIDQAMLLCQDALLRTKGLFSLSSFITDLDMKECQRNLNRKNWGEIVDKIVSEIKSREDYIVYIIRYMLENETQLFSIEDLFPDSIELFENVLANNSEDDVFKRGNQWLQDSDKNVLNIFWQLIIYIYNYFRRSETYLTFTEKDSLVVANYFADIVLTQITQLNESKRLKYTLQELSNWLLQLNDSMGFLDNFKNNVISQEEKAGIEQEITEYFSLTNLQHASGNEIVSICKKMYFFEGEDLQTYLLLIKEWIIEHCKKEKEGVDEEKELLSVMEYYVCVVNKEKPNQIVNSYLELWEEILNQGIHIELSRSSMYILRRCITGFSFEQGIRMRKIIENISLQR